MDCFTVQIIKNRGMRVGRAEGGAGGGRGWDYRRQYFISFSKFLSRKTLSADSNTLKSNYLSR